MHLPALVELGRLTIKKPLMKKLLGVGKNLVFSIDINMFDSR
jgi:hypothetical protein